MVALILGIALVVLAHAIVMPYPIYLLLVIAGALLILYGLLVIFRVLGGAPGPVEPTTRRRRFWY